MAIELSNFFIVNLPENLIAKFSAEGFEFVEGVEVEQGFVDVDELVGQVMRFVERCRQVVVATKAGGNRH